MQFKDVIGQRPTKELLMQLALEQRVPHAILLIGPPGNGKLGMALAFAQYLNCREKTETDSCGVCSSCLKFRKLIHPDLHFTVPVIKTSAITKPTTADYMQRWREYFIANPYPLYERWNQTIAEENKQGMIYVDEASEIIQKLNTATGARRLAALPELPTVAESGVPGYEVASWYGLLAPAQTPRAIVDRLNREVVAILRQPEVRDRLAADGAEAVGNSPEEFAAHIRRELARWAAVIKAAGIRPE